MNFDLNTESSFEEIKDLNPAYFRTLLYNDEIFIEIILTLFPQKKTLSLLLKYFEEKQKKSTIYNTLHKILLEKLK